VPVLLTRPGLRPPERGLERILVAVDGSDASGEVFETVRLLAADRDPEVLLVEVVTPVGADLGTMGVPLVLPADPAPSLEEQVTRLRKMGLRASPVVAHGDPATEILRQGRKFQVDLIAMATAGRKGLSRILLGSVAENVVRRMDRAVVLQRIAPTREALHRIQEQHAPGSD
jgi:nucleotide-binding universal stress UspA family protein